jgi:hypothetical protein
MDTVKNSKLVMQENALVMSLANSVTGNRGVIAHVLATVFKRDHVPSKGIALARVMLVLVQQSKFSHAILASSVVSITPSMSLQMSVPKSSHQ